MSASEIKIVKKRSLKKYIPEIDLEETGEPLIDEMEENSDETFAITLDKKVIGIAYVDDDKSAYITVNIFKAYRKLGYGTAALKQVEKMIVKADKITAIYGYHNEIAKQFLIKHGYKPTWASTMMKYDGPKFQELNLPIRRYKDEDFDQAYSLSAEAFHKMRVGTGCFPDSVVSTPSENSRKNWLEEAENEYVIDMNGEIVGYANIDGEELDSVSIKITHQGKGLGKAFIKYMTNRLIDRGVKEPILWCVVGNVNARHIYDSLGYKEVFCVGYADKKIHR